MIFLKGGMPIENVAKLNITVFLMWNISFFWHNKQLQLLHYFLESASLLPRTN